MYRLNQNVLFLSFFLSCCLLVSCSQSQQHQKSLKHPVRNSGAVDERVYIIELEQPPLFSFEKDLLLRGEAITEEKLHSYREELRSHREKTLERIEKSLSHTRQNSFSVEAHYDTLLHGIALLLSPKDLEHVRSIPGVKAIHKNPEVEPLSRPDPKLFLEQTQALTKVDRARLLDKDGNQCESTNKECISGKGVTIAIVDSGINYNDPNLTSSNCFGQNCKVIGGYDFINRDSNPIDDRGHGTDMAIIAAGNGILKGVAPEAKLYAYKVLDSSGIGYISTLISGIERAMDPNSDGSTADHADIINLSLATDFADPEGLLAQVVNRAVDLGALVVCSTATGMTWRPVVRCPACAKKSLSVSWGPASDAGPGPYFWNDEIFLKPDLIAPGALFTARPRLFSFTPGNGPMVDQVTGEGFAYDEWMGHSLAAAHVSGIAALIKHAHPSWGPMEIETALKSTAEDVGESTFEQGMGRVNALESVKSKSIMVAELHPRRVGEREVELRGSAFGEGFERYAIQYRRNGESTWLPFSEHSTPVEEENGLLATGFLEENVAREIIEFRLSVYNTQGEKFIDQGYYYNSRGNALKIPEKEDRAQVGPRIHEDKIVYVQQRKVRTGYHFYQHRYSFHIYDLKSKTVSDIRTNFGPLDYDIYGDYVIYTEKYDLQNDLSHLHLYKISDKSNRTIASGKVSSVAIHGNNIVWNANGIQHYDIATRRLRSLSVSGTAEDLDIFENTVVYEKSDKIYSFDLSQGTEQVLIGIGKNSVPKIYDKYLTWAKGSRFALRDLESGEETSILPNNAGTDWGIGSPAYGLEIHGNDVVAYWRRNPKHYVQHYNIETGEKTTISNHSGSGYNFYTRTPSVHNGNIVWFEKGGLYHYDLSASGPDLNWHNANYPEDVSADGAVTPRDAVLVINMLLESDGNVPDISGKKNTTSPRILPDVNNNKSISPADAVLVIQELLRISSE